jgi:hypothetical protein
MFLVTLDTWPGNGGRRPKGQERGQVSLRFASFEGAGQFFVIKNQILERVQDFS